MIDTSNGTGTLWTIFIVRASRKGADAFLATTMAMPSGGEGCGMIENVDRPLRSPVAGSIFASLFPRSGQQCLQIV